MSIPVRLHQPLTLVLWLCYGLACTWLALALSWRGLAGLDYGYPLWYQILAIDEHIDQYAPENVRKRGFEQLPPEQHHRAFAQISRAVHSSGRGLEEIHYPGPTGEPVPLLYDDEIAHLRDVGDLLRLGAWASLVVVVVWVLLALMVVRRSFPSMRARLVGACLPAGVVGCWLLLAGPEGAFYQLHEWIFPPENPWFFYWEESLMSTLMKAPVLFGAIAVVLALAAVIVTPVLYWLGLAVARKGRHLRAV